MKSLAPLCLVAVELFGCTRIPTAIQPQAAPSAHAFAFLEIHGHQLMSTHEIKVIVEQPRGFRAVGPVNYLPTFSRHPFAVSLAAFLGDGAFVMVHAERVLDGSGASNYSNLEPVKVSAFEFRTKVQCADLTMEDVAGEHDLALLASHGFAPTPAVYVRQLFRTTDDHNAELVLTYGERLTSCAESSLTPAFIAAFNERLLQTIHIH